MRKRSKGALAAAVLICLMPATSLALTQYFQDFEAMFVLDPNALGNDGWVVYGNVFAAADTSFLYGYGTFPAPNNPDAPGFSMLAEGEGGDEQGLLQLSIFSDYQNLGAHDAGDFVVSNTFQEQPITEQDVGSIWTFSFQAKRGNIVAPSTAEAFIKTIDPASNYDMTNYVTLDMTAIPDTWGGYFLVLPIDSGLVGQLFQFGFANTASNYVSSGIFYDNVLFERTGYTDVPDGSLAVGAALSQNYPNPFNPLTRIDFSLESEGHVEVSVFDVAGRKVATLHSGDLGVGDHHVIWNGKTDRGAMAPAGQYSYVLRTKTGQVARSMMLLK